MKYLSLFSGIGGFELGINQAYDEILSSMGSEPTDQKSGQTEPEVQLRRERSAMEKGHSLLSADIRRERPVCIGFSEIDKYATQIYKKHFNHSEYGDITKIDPRFLPDFDLIVGGFPCQSFSIAGKRGGFSDTRGTLFFEIARIAREKQPRFMLLENVKGLLSHDKGYTFATILTTLDELGYDAEWQVLNSKDFGVPQNRERVFIVCYLRGQCGGKIFPLGEDGGKNDKTCQKKRRSREGFWEVDTCTTLRGKEPTSGCDTLVQALTESGHTPIVNRIRRLTPIECERLQGLPDNWTKWGIEWQKTNQCFSNKIKVQTEISDTQRYKCLGNAVTTNVIKAIITKLLPYVYKSI